MVYITRANALRIIRNSAVKTDIIGDIYKKPIYVFSNKEKQSLLAIKALLDNPGEYFTKYYQPIEHKDTYTYVFESNKAAYHLSTNCDRLNSDFNNFKIPTAIKEQGQEGIKTFRKWFKENQHLLADPPVFEARLLAAFGAQINLKADHFENSGIDKIEDLDLSGLEAKIDGLLKDAGRYYYASAKNEAILSRWGKGSNAAYVTGKLNNNDTEYSDEDIKAFLVDYNDRFKKPLRQFLIEYYKVKHNPDLSFDGQLLERLGFSVCSHCNNGLDDINDPFGIRFEISPVNKPKPEKKFYTKDTMPNEVKRIVDHVEDIQRSFTWDIPLMNGDIEEGQILSANCEFMYPDVRMDFYFQNEEIQFIRFYCDEWEVHAGLPPSRS